MLGVERSQADGSQPLQALAAPLQPLVRSRGSTHLGQRIEEILYDRAAAVRIIAPRMTIAGIAQYVKDNGQRKDAGPERARKACPRITGDNG
jgi:hypothetical protein